MRQVFYAVVLVTCVAAFMLVTASPSQALVINNASGVSYMNRLGVIRLNPKAHRSFILAPEIGDVIAVRTEYGEDTTEYSGSYENLYILITAETPDTLSLSFDGVFHYVNNVRYGVETRSLTVEAAIKLRDLGWFDRIVSINCSYGAPNVWEVVLDATKADSLCVCGLTVNDASVLLISKSEAVKRVCVLACMIVERYVEVSEINKLFGSLANLKHLSADYNGEHLGAALSSVEKLQTLWLDGVAPDSEVASLVHSQLGLMSLGVRLRIASANDKIIGALFLTKLNVDWLSLCMNSSIAFPAPLLETIAGCRGFALDGACLTNEAVEGLFNVIEKGSHEVIRLSYLGDDVIRCLEERPLHCRDLIGLQIVAERRASVVIDLSGCDSLLSLVLGFLDGDKDAIVFPVSLLQLEIKSLYFTEMPQYMQVLSKLQCFILGVFSSDGQIDCRAFTSLRRITIGRAIGCEYLRLIGSSDIEVLTMALENPAISMYRALGTEGIRSLALFGSVGEECVDGYAGSFLDFPALTYLELNKVGIVNFTQIASLSNLATVILCDIDKVVFDAEQVKADVACARIAEVYVRANEYSAMRTLPFGSMRALKRLTLFGMMHGNDENIESLDLSGCVALQRVLLCFLVIEELKLPAERGPESVLVLYRVTVSNQRDYDSLGWLVIISGVRA